MNINEEYGKLYYINELDLLYYYNNNFILDNIDSLNIKSKDKVIFNNNLFMPFINNIGKLYWINISNIYKYQVNNIYYITTQSGRNIIIPNYKKISIWNDKKEIINKENIKNIKIGDKIPILYTIESSRFPIYNQVYKNNIKIDDIYFLLDYENGLFIGLYLAQNKFIKNLINIYLSNSHNNKNIIIFSKKWFNKFNISYDITDEYISGFSHKMEYFLSSITNYYNENRCICNDIYSSPNTFIIGLLNGFFSYCGIFYNNLVYIKTKYKRLINGIIVLLNIIGIFSEIRYETDTNEYLLFIKNEWYNKFINYMNDINIFRQYSLLNINKVLIKYNINEDYKIYNDIIIDKIIDIENKDYNKYIHDLNISLSNSSITFFHK